jgi:hypothetical protein
MKVKDVLEALNGLPSEEMVAIQWYTKDDIELNLQRKITREVWEDVCEYACGEPDMSDFSECEDDLLERAERDSE